MSEPLIFFPLENYIPLDTRIMNHQKGPTMPTKIIEYAKHPRCVYNFSQLQDLDNDPGYKSYEINIPVITYRSRTIKAKNLKSAIKQALKGFKPNEVSGDLRIKHIHIAARKEFFSWNYLPFRWKIKNKLPTELNVIGTVEVIHMPLPIEVPMTYVQQDKSTTKEIQL